MAGNNASGRKPANTSRHPATTVPGKPAPPPAPPRWIGRAARAEWQRSARKLAAAGKLTATTKPGMVAMTCTLANFEALHRLLLELDAGEVKTRLAVLDRLSVLGREVRQWMKALEITAAPPELEQPELPGLSDESFIAARPA